MTTEEYEHNIRSDGKRWRTATILSTDGLRRTMAMVEDGRQRHSNQIRDIVVDNERRKGNWKAQRYNQIK